MKKLTALILAVIMIFVLAACDGAKPADPTQKPDEPVPTAEPQPEAKKYTWDVKVVYDRYDAVAGEIPPVVTVTEKASGSTMSVDPEAAINALEDPSDLTPLQEDSNSIVLTGTIESENVEFNESDWTADDAGRGSKFTFEVLTPLTEGDYDTHGEIKLNARAKDFLWKVTVDFGEGTEGTYEITNPGLDSWEEPYVNQKFTVTPENNTFDLYEFNQSAWIVDNTRDWYKWVIYDVDDVAPYYNFEIVTPLELGKRDQIGELTIHLSLTQ